jgi:hypothetical protein
LSPAQEIGAQEEIDHLRPPSPEFSISFYADYEHLAMTASPRLEQLCTHGISVFQEAEGNLPGTRLDVSHNAVASAATSVKMRGKRCPAKTDTLHSRRKPISKRPVHDRALRRSERARRYPQALQQPTGPEKKSKTTRRGVGVATTVPTPNSTTPLAQRVANSGPPKKTQAQAQAVWYTRLNELVSYQAEHGNCNVPQQLAATRKLGIWVNKQRMEKKFMDMGLRSSMTADRVQALEQVGFGWGKLRGQFSWDARYQQLVEYAAIHGHCEVPTKCSLNKTLGRWVSTQRWEYKQYCQNRPTLMTTERCDKLKQLQFVFVADKTKSRPDTLSFTNERERVCVSRKDSTSTVV